MKYIEKLNLIKLNLEKCERVNKHTTQEENQADTLANTYIDIEDGLKVIIEEQIPKLYLKDLTKEEVDELILDIGEELRHMLYHIKDTKVYSYLDENK